MPRTKNTALIGTRSTALAEMIERLALAACGSALWPNPYARDYHRAAARRMLAAIRDSDIVLIKGMK